MKNTKQDDIGYCLQITPMGINVAKIFQHDPRINTQEVLRLFIRCMVDSSPSKTLDNGFVLDVASAAFSDRSIDIFCDDESILKNLPLVARTPSGMPLHGNLCILGSDDEGNSLLLTEDQVTTVLQELDFLADPYVNQIDLTDSESLVNDDSEDVGTLRKLLEALVNHCVNNGVQLVTRAKAISKDTDDSVLIVCLHGNDAAIKQLHSRVQKLMRSCEFGKSI